MLIFLLLGIMVYIWTKERYGAKAGLLSLFLTVFSPNIIANGRYVTTDVAAAFGFILGSYFFVKFINNQTKRNLIYAGLAFGIAQLLKFSFNILIPLFVFTGFAYWPVSKDFFLAPYFISSVYFYYWLFTGLACLRIPCLEISHRKAKTDTRFTLRSYPIKPAANLVIWATDKPLLAHTPNIHFCF